MVSAHIELRTCCNALSSFSPDLKAPFASKHSFHNARYFLHAFNTSFPKFIIVSPEILHQNNYFLNQENNVPLTHSSSSTGSEVKRKCVYDPTKWQVSLWHQDYVLSDKCKDRTSREGKLFRRRFRMPWETYKTMVKEMRDDDWFGGKVGGQTALG